jgi:hypothetical protein
MARLRHAAMSAIAPLLEPSGSETDSLKPINEAVGVAHTSFRLSSESHVERTVCDERVSVRQRLADASASDCPADELQALGLC